MRKRRSLVRAAAAGAALAGALALAPTARAAEPPEPVALAFGANGVAVAEGTLEPLDVDAYTVSLNVGDRLFAALFDEKDGAFLDTRVGALPGRAAPAGRRRRRRVPLAPRVRGDELPAATSCA